MLDALQHRIGIPELVLMLVLALIGAGWRRLTR